jgi:hypothetical protein
MGMGRGEGSGAADFWHEEGEPQVCFLAARGENGREKLRGQEWRCCDQSSLRGGLRKEPPFSMMQ